MNQWIKLQEPEARKFLIFWRNIFDMTGLKNIKFNRAVEMMAIYFLQIHGYLPGFKSLLKDESKKESLEFKEYYYYHYGLKHLSDYKQLVRPFLKYFLKFDWYSNIVCTYLGKPVTRSEFLLKSDLAV